MPEIWSGVFGLSALLALAVLLQPVAKWLRLPYTVVLALAGAGLAFAMRGLGLSAGHEAEAATHHAGGWQQALGALTGFNLTADIILFVFLPALVFESAMSLDLRKLRQDLATIMFLAVIGVLLSAVIAGVALWQFSGVALIACLLIGAIVSATDPVAVIALFKDLGAPKRLTILVEGESLFNDATAIVVATIFLSLLTTAAEPSVMGASLDFLRVFGIGVLVGMVMARIAIAIMEPFRDNAVSIISLSLVLPFIAFVTAEHFLHVSGVMAVVVSGLAMGSHGRRVIPPHIFGEMEHVWHQLGFWATALIFLLVGITVPTLLGDHFIDYLDEAVILFVAATAARALILYGFLPALSAAKVIERVSPAYQTIMLWGGLRGAVSLALALVVLNFPGIDQELAHFVAVLITVFVFATLLLQATTISTVMGWLGLGKLSAFDETLRERSVAWARQSVRAELESLVNTQVSTPEHFDDILAQYSAAPNTGQSTADTEDWLRTGLNLALGQERQFYLEAYGEGAVSGPMLRELLARIDDTTEALQRLGTGDATDTACAATLATFTAHSRSFRIALGVQRQLGFARPLADQLAQRFALLSAALSALGRQQAEGLGEIAALLPADAAARFEAVHAERLADITTSQRALWRQYPTFAASLDRHEVTRTALRLERQAYDRLKESGLIGPEIYGALLADLEKRAPGRLPRLDLTFDPVALIGSVPLFAALSAGERRRIAQRLKTRFVAPGERILAAGDPGDSMYFIANGAVRILRAGDEPIGLGTGDYFGEIALVTGAPRTADVVSDGYSTLLQLEKPEFERLAARNPKLADAIRRTAQERLRANA